MHAKHRILIVEDTESLRKTIKAKLILSGFAVDEAADAAEAERALRKRAPCLIYLDILLPKVLGLEFLGKIRRDPRFRATPVIVVTQFDVESYREQAARLGVLEYFVKADTSLLAIIYRTREILKKCALGGAGGAKDSARSNA